MQSMDSMDSLDSMDSMDFMDFMDSMDGFYVRAAPSYWRAAAECHPAEPARGMPSRNHKPGENPNHYNRASAIKLRPNRASFATGLATGQYS